MDDRILDKISQLYVLQNVERSSAEASQRLQFLRSQLPVVRLDLEKAEAAADWGAATHADPHNADRRFARAAGRRTRSRAG